MLVDHFPLLGLRIRTPLVELRLPTPEELSDLADVAADGIHEPDQMPFMFRWSTEPPAKRARGVVQSLWRKLGSISPDDWDVPLTVFYDGQPVGVQGINAEDFPKLRRFRSHSWLGQRFQGKGIGTHTRAAVLHLGFAGLGAYEAATGAFTDNPASLAISRKLGYQPNGTERDIRGDGQIATTEWMLMSREDWTTHATIDVTIEGLEPCRPLLLGEDE